MTIASIDPCNGKLLETFRELGDAEVEKCIDRAAKAFHEYRQTSFRHRAERLTSIADLLDKQADALGAMISLEMGKPISAAIAEVQKSARACRYYADHGAQHLADEAVETEAKKSFVRCLPLGPILAIMPWNFPFWQVFRFAAPALMAGNVVLLKHASSVPRCALAIENVVRRAGFEEGVFQTLLIESRRVESIIDDPRIRGVTLTGSTEAGHKVAGRSGARLKKTVLELGGSDPFIVMPTARVSDAARIAVESRTVNNGQSCIAAKRFIVHRDVYALFEERFVREMKALRIGDPMDPDTQIGPLATKESLTHLEQQVADSISAGARILTGGRPLGRDGFFYPPTVLADVPRGSPAYEDEIFGPVASLFRVDDIDEAIELANATRFGLASSVWTESASEIERFADELDAGVTFVNAMVASDPRLPFGGVKDSGYGRELSREGIREFTNVKSIYVM